LIDHVLSILEERRQAFAAQAGAASQHRGGRRNSKQCPFRPDCRFGLRETVRRERREAARHEVEHIRDLVRRQPIGIQIGVLEGQPSAQPSRSTKHKDHSASRSALPMGRPAQHLFRHRAGDSVPEAGKAFRHTFARQWERARKGVKARLSCSGCSPGRWRKGRTPPEDDTIEAPFNRPGWRKPDASLMARRPGDTIGKALLTFSAILGEEPMPGVGAQHVCRCGQRVKDQPRFAEAGPGVEKDVMIQKW